MGKVFLVIAVIVMLFMFLHPIQKGVHDWRTDQITKTVSITTGGGVTIGSVVFTRALFNDDESEITSVGSAIAETPILGTYVPATKTLSLTNLTESQTRVITIVYYAETQDSILMIIGPFLAF